MGATVDPKEIYRSIKDLEFHLRIAKHNQSVARTRLEQWDQDIIDTERKILELKNQ